MTIEERAKHLIKMYVGGNPGELLTKVKEALQAERDLAEVTLKAEALASAYNEGKEDMREMAAKLVEKEARFEQWIAKEIRDLK